jgi:hypothetical protein
MYTTYRFFTTALDRTSGRCWWIRVDWPGLWRAGAAVLMTGRVQQRATRSALSRFFDRSLPFSISHGSLGTVAGNLYRLTTAIGSAEEESLLLRQLDYLEATGLAGGVLAPLLERTWRSTDRWGGQSAAHVAEAIAEVVVLAGRFGGNEVAWSTFSDLAKNRAAVSPVTYIQEAGEVTTLLLGSRELPAG